MNEELILKNLPEIIKTTSSGLSLIKSTIWIIDYFARHEPVHVKERLGRSLELMSEYMREKHESKDPGDAWRNDWFSENQVSGNRIPHRLLEKTIKEIIDDSEERKSEYVAKFWVNVCLTSNADIDEATAFSYFETIESLSWRQLCIIRLAILYKNQEIVGCSLNEENIEQMPQDQRTMFFSIGREFEKLMDAHYIQGIAMFRSEETNDPLLLRPSVTVIPAYTRRLHSLMNLDEIPIKEIEEIFSLWHVKRKESE